MIAAMQALESGKIPAADLYKDILTDRDRLLDEIRKRDQKIADLDRCLTLAADMIEAMQKVRG